jgi:hypothetical protein
MDEIQKQFRQTLEQAIGEEHVLDWESSWRQFSKDQRLKILKAIACRKEAEEKLRASISFEGDNGAERRIFERHIETKLQLEKQLVEILGERNTEYLLAGFLDRLSEDINFGILYLDALRDLQSELTALANGEKTPFTRALLKRGRGERNDARPIRHLKDRIGDVYRALRHGGASSDHAVDTINAVLRNNGQPGMTKDAIQSRAPGDLLDLSPYDPIHYVRPVVEGKELPRKAGESFEASLERHARQWLRRALREANRTARN